MKAGKRIRIFVGELQQWRGKPLYREILEQAHRHGALSALVFRGIEGFGPEHHLSTGRLVETAENLPIMIDIVEQDEHIDALLAVLHPLVGRGMITITPVRILNRERHA